MWILVAKLPNSDLNFAVYFWVDFCLLFFPRKKARKNPPKNPPQNLPRTLFGKMPLGFLQKPFLENEGVHDTGLAKHERRNADRTLLSCHCDFAVIRPEFSQAGFKGGDGGREGVCTSLPVHGLSALPVWQPYCHTNATSHSLLKGQIACDNHLPVRCQRVQSVRHHMSSPSPRKCRYPLFAGRFRPMHLVQGFNTDMSAWNTYTHIHARSSELVCASGLVHSFTLRRRCRSRVPHLQHEHLRCLELCNSKGESHWNSLAL